MSRTMHKNNFKKVSWVLYFRLFFVLTPKYLCKPTRGDSHFHGHVSPMFCNMSNFFFYVTRAILDSLTCFLSLAVHGCVTLLKLMLTRHCRVSTELDVILNLLFLSKHSPHSFILVSMMFNLTKSTKEPYTCHHDKSELRSCLPRHVC